MLGSWSEGEERSGDPLPGAQRVYWHRWTAWWTAQQELLAAQRCPDWGQAITLAEDDRQVVASAQDDLSSHLGEPQHMIAVAATHWEMADWLCEACRQWGYASVGMNPRERLPSLPVTAVIWDCRDPGNLAELVRLRQHFGDVPVLALTNFPRWQHRESLLTAGVATALSKPVRLNELRAALDALIPASKIRSVSHVA